MAHAQTLPPSVEQMLEDFTSWMARHAQAKITVRMDYPDGSYHVTTQDYRVAALDSSATESIDRSARSLFVARLEAMQRSGDHWLTIVAVLALLNDCDMLEYCPDEMTPEQIAEWERHQKVADTPL